MARHSQRSIAVFAVLSVFAMLAVGCGTSMQTSSEDLNRLTTTEGIVVGSVHIKGGKDILGSALSSPRGQNRGLSLP